MLLAALPLLVGAAAGVEDRRDWAATLRADARAFTTASPPTIRDR